MSFCFSVQVYDDDDISSTCSLYLIAYHASSTKVFFAFLNTSLLATCQSFLPCTENITLFRGLDILKLHGMEFSSTFYGFLFLVFRCFPQYPNLVHLQISFLFHCEPKLYNNRFNFHCRLILHNHLTTGDSRVILPLDNHITSNNEALHFYNHFVLAYGLFTVLFFTELLLWLSKLSWPLLKPVFLKRFILL
jgi:hypothetical protein